MKAHKFYEVIYVHLDYPEMMVEWGTPGRRKKMKPTSLTVKYDKLDGEQWKLHTVYLGGNRVHKQASFGFGVFFTDFGKVKYPMPAWMVDLVEQANPGAAK